MITSILPLKGALLLTLVLALNVPAFSAPLPGGGGSTDACADAVPVMLEAGGSVTLSGNNSNATAAGDFDPDLSPFAGATAVWHAFTITECMDVTYSYCGQSPAWTDTWGFLFTSCPATTATGPNNFNNTECADGNNTYYHWALPAGTYYIAVPQIMGSIGAYSIELSATACPPSAENDDCADVVPTQLNPGATIEFNGDNSTATFNNDFAETSPFLGAAVVWHAFTINECMNVNYSFCGQDPVWVETWGFLFTDCPGDQPTGPDSFNTTACADGNNTYEHWQLDPGTYYIAVPVIEGSTGPYTITVTSSSCGFPSNDQCGGITPQALAIGSSLEFIGDNSGATDQNDFVPGHDFTAPVVWHAFTLAACTDVTISYCGLDPVWNNTFGILTTTCPGDEVILFDPTSPTACPDGNTTYTFIDLEPGTYYLPVLNHPEENATGPYTITATAVNCLSTSMAEVNNLQWSIFPNPSEGTFSLNNSGEKEIISIEVLDLSGRVVNTFNTRILPNATGTVSTEGLSAGIYVVRVTNSAKQRFEQQLIVR